MNSAVLLCAGESLRLGRAKALLNFGGETLLARILEQLRLASFSQIICVTGAHAHEIENEIAKFPAASIQRNPDFKTGLMSSVQAGLRKVSPQATGAVFSLVDLPYLRAEDFRIAAEVAPNHLVRFYYKGMPAHPVYIPRRYFAEVLEQPSQDQGCGFLFQKYKEDVRWIAADSPRGLLDIDTAEDYSAHLTS